MSEMTYDMTGLTGPTDAEIREAVFRGELVAIRKRLLLQFYAHESSVRPKTTESPILPTEPQTWSRTQSRWQ
jgi:hypothetical protein